MIQSPTFYLFSFFIHIQSICNSYYTNKTLASNDQNLENDCCLEDRTEVLFKQQQTIDNILDLIQCVNMDIININIGQEGTRIGNEMIKQMHSQHFSESQKPKGRYSTFFGETKKQIYPRSMFYDVNDIKGNNFPFSKQITYKSQNILTQSRTSRNLFGQTYYKCSEEYIESVRDSIRKQIQRQGSIGGFLFVSSLGSGTGSGLTSKVLSIVRQDYSSKMTQSFRLLPELQLYTHPIEIYNSAFSIYHQVENCDMSLFFDYASIAKFLYNQKQLTPSIDQLNHKIGSIISDSTIPFRFAGKQNTSQRKIANNLTIFPRIHFYTFSSNNLNQNPLISALNPQNFLSNKYFQNSLNSSIYSVYAGVRSHFISQIDVHPIVKRQFDKSNLKFVEWIADNVHISCHQPINGRQNTNIFVNSQHFNFITNKISQLFTNSFRRKAFFHHYASLGIDQMQFTQIQSNLNDLNSQYQPPVYYDHQDLLSDQIEDQN